MILISLTTACGSPALVVPHIEYKSYAEIMQEQPDCTGELNQMEAAFNGGASVDAEAAAIDALKCYHVALSLWKNYYRILDAKLQSISR